jgi:hypothetical protein
MQAQSAYNIIGEDIKLNTRPKPERAIDNSTSKNMFVENVDTGWRRYLANKRELRYLARIYFIF